MKIAQIAPLMEAVPPRLYGGTERIVSFLTEELVAQGHEVTLFASGQSMTSARLIPCCEEPLRLKGVKNPVPYYMAMLDKVRRMADDFDILHFHIEQLHFPLFRDLAGRTLTTLHSRQDLPDVQSLYAGFPEMPLVSISNAQRTPVLNANFLGTVLHGLPCNLLTPTLTGDQGYLAFLGRICPEKRPDQAIAIAQTVGMRIKLAAKVDRVDEAYFHAEIEPLLDRPGVEFVGEIGDANKADFLGNARALLFPIDWPEPFGMVMIEAMACGTPVLAYRRGSAPEVIDEGVTGFIVDGFEEAVRQMGAVLSLDREQIRRRFEERFSASRMAKDYCRIYGRLIGAKTAAKPDWPSSTRIHRVPLQAEGEVHPVWTGHPA